MTKLCNRQFYPNIPRPNVNPPAGYVEIFSDESTGGTLTILYSDGTTRGFGKSAYESWLSLGNTGSEQDFIDSLKGQDSNVVDLINDGVVAPNYLWSGTYLDSEFQKKVSTTLEIEAGVGLIGGGSLTQCRTIALGEPGTLTTNTINYSSDISHWHEIHFPVTSIAGRTGDIVLTPADIDGLELAQGVPGSTTVDAGDGLTGGGDLTQDRVITMGLPSTLSSLSINEVTEESHTHQVNFPVESVAGKTGAVTLDVNDISGWSNLGGAPTTLTLTAGQGLTGGGTLEADRTFNLGTPSTLNTTTTNALYADTHTHEVVFPVTTVAGRTGDIVLSTSDLSDWSGGVTETRLVNAGDGLTGGGALSADVTLNLGTPSTLDISTTNATTSVTHSHAVTFPVQSVAGKTGAVTLTASDVGLGNVLNEEQVSALRNMIAGSGLTGGGTLEADRTFNLGTPSTLTPSTLNSVTSTSHTHQVSFPVTEVSGRTGAITLTKTDVNLSNVDNTSDADKPISIATQNALDNKVNISLLGAASGVATLGTNGKVPLTQIDDTILGQVEYMGIWNASTNTPTLPTIPTEKGHYYIVSVAGSQFSLDFEIGDWIISNGSSWDKVDNTDSVNSVAGKTGNVTLSKSDVGLSNVDNVQQAPITTEVNAGDGLTGGGDLSQNRTIILGTPSSLNNTTTNAITTNSHTHEVSYPVDSVAGKTGDVVLTKSDVDLDNVLNVAQAAASLTLIAGDGLTGGGNLTLNRTFTLGDPGTLTLTSTNTVSADSHTHQVNFPVESVAGKTGNVTLTKSDVGLNNVDNVQQAPATRTISAGAGLTGGGNLTADRTVSMGTPSTLNITSTNSVTGETHSHSILFPVTTVSGKTGDVTLSKSDVGLANVDNVQQAPILRNIIAGNGLTGGGNLTADRTITMGLPSTLSLTSSNQVSSDSHEHAINFPVTTVAGRSGDVTLSKSDVGLSNVDNVQQAPITRTFAAGSGLTGGGSFGADRTFNLGTPGTLNITSTNSVTTTSHTHQVTFPVTTVSGRTGDITLDKTDVGLSNVDNTADVNKPISGPTQAALNLKVDSNILGADNGVATLDSNGKVPLSQINDSILGQVEYMGLWDPSSNTPTLPTTPTEKGHYYIASGTGTQFGIDFVLGDWIVSNGSTWDKVDNTDAVSSVAGKTGAVTLDKTDVGLSNVDNIQQAPATRDISSGAGLTGGGDLSADRLFALGTPSTLTSSTINESINNTHTHEVIYPINSVAGRTGDVVLTKSDVGLSNVDNTSDLDKPISTATQTALDLKATITALNLKADQTAVDLKADSSLIGSNNGIASLDNNGKVPLSQINDSILGQVDYKGVWDASSNTPELTLVSNVKGDYYITSAAGTQFSTDFQIGDWIVFNGTSWDKVDNTDSVTSVAGRTGAVVLTKSDVALNNVDNTSDLNKPISTATQTALDLKADQTAVDLKADQTSLDLKINKTSIVDGGTGLTELWSANYLDGVIGDIDSALAAILGV